MELSIHEIAIVSATFELKPSFARFLAVYKIALKFDLVEVPELSSFPMLHVVLPISDIQAALSITKDALAFRLSILPVSLVDVAIRVGHAPFAVEHPIDCLTLVHRPVWKLDSSEPHPPGFRVLVCHFPDRRSRR